MDNNSLDQLEKRLIKAQEIKKDIELAEGFLLTSLNSSEFGFSIQLSNGMLYQSLHFNNEEFNKYFKKSIDECVTRYKNDKEQIYKDL